MKQLKVMLMFLVLGSVLFGLNSAFADTTQSFLMQPAGSNVLLGDLVQEDDLNPGNSNIVCASNTDLKIEIPLDVDPTTFIVGELSNPYKGSNYCLESDVFAVNLVSGGLQTEISESLVFQTDDTRINPVILNGLRITRDAVLASSDEPLLKIVHNSPATLVLNDIQMHDVKNGLRIEAAENAGPIYIFNSTVKGPDTSNTIKEGICYDVTADSVVLNGIEASNCNRGVSVSANNVLITNDSFIHDNNVGIEQTAGHAGLKFLSSKVYNNSDYSNSTSVSDDAIRLQPQVKRDLEYYEVVEHDDEYVAQPKTISDEGIYEYSDKAFIVLPENISSNGVVRFYYSRQEECVINVNWLGQICDYSEIAPVENNSPVNEASVLADVPLVMIYSDSLGSTVVSKPFRMSGSVYEEHGPVAIVQNPLEIPTPGNEDTGNTSSGGGSTDPGNIPPPSFHTGDEEGDDDDRTTTQMSSSDEDPDGISIGSGASSGGCGRGGSSLVAVSTTTVFFSSLGMLWIILVIALLASLRAVYIHINKPTRRR